MTFDLLDPKSMLVGAFAIIKNHSRELKSGRPNHGSGGFVIFLHPYTQSVTYRTIKHDPTQLN